MNKTLKVAIYIAIGFMISALLYKELIRPFYLTTCYIYSEKYQRKAESLKKIEIKESTILFIGNSLMVGFNASTFSKNSAKWAIPGDILCGLEWRLEALIDKKPKSIIINLGINDIISGFGFSSEKLEEYILNFKEITPNSELFIMSLSPENLSPGTFTSPEKIALEIKQANKEIELLCLTHSLTFIDVYSGLESNGRLISDYTYDGLHLTEEGYGVWEKIILQSFNSVP